MKKILEFDKRILFLFIMSISLKYSYGQLFPYNNPVFDTVLSDNFNTNSGPYLNSTNWHTFYPWGGGNFFTSDTVTAGIPWCPRIQDLANITDGVTDTNNRRIRNNMCTLIAKDSVTTGKWWKYYNYPSATCTSLGLGPCNWSPSQCLDERLVPYKYSAGMMLSKKRIKYGYIEMRFRLRDWEADKKRGYSLNFWMYANSATIPHSEIDIFEIDCDSGMYTSNVHVDPTADAIKTISEDGYPYGDEPFVGLSQNTPGGNGWHIATCYWSPDSITFSYDNNPLWYHKAENTDTNQYLLPMPLIIDFGLEATNFCGANVTAQTVFPVYWDIDYVKVWQPKLACDTAKTYCNITAASFTNKIYKNLTIGGSSCTAAFNNGQAGAIGAEYVLLQEGVEIGSNMEMLIDVWPCWTEQKFETMPTPNPPPADFLNRKPSYNND